ncbi:carboxylesterase 4A-like [Amyelois transitella]|uniref:carboxylesterase 4A-like n=1 Tax=Amyelois transitella TaxID=680683 RepID=UPI0029907CA2|nr:carboxylesterase 4A-like [Amyelois transitella]
MAQGRMKGVYKDGYVSYFGIPYATINSPASKFKVSPKFLLAICKFSQSAGLAPIWSGVRKSEQRHCTMFSPAEDCLHLDVHTPSAGDFPWPILVWVKGSSGQYNPEKLVKQGIIVVVVSHRMGPVGFLCLKDEKVPGNAGAKDVVLALRWVRDNIVAFKGNPHRVVVAGQGFGAAMVEAVMMSTTGDGLYHGAILQSGSILSPLAFNHDATVRAEALATMISDDDDHTMTLLNATVEELASKSENIDKPYFPFGLCTENYFKYEDILISDHPYELMKKKRGIVPMMLGYNSDEAYLFATALKQFKVPKRLSGDISFLLPEELKFMNEGEIRHVSRQIQDVYFKHNTTLAAALAYHRDAYFVSHVYRSVRHHSSANRHPVYFYQFSHVGDLGVTPEPGVNKTGAAFSDELAYLFPAVGQELEGPDRVVQENLIRIWTNFVKHLNPSSNGIRSPWLPVEPSAPRLLDINHELKMEAFPHTKEAHLWNDIYEKYYYNRNRADAA